MHTNTKQINTQVNKHDDIIFSTVKGNNNKRENKITNEMNSQ